ncbi:hypothetical protein JZ00_30510 [Pseudomonas frederiksbergensis]|uniref:Uncharacterized protein n=1 Tax=Pseudomonas frederiksbergensis TaxID=104087 RepID=A0A0U1PQN5_9PSED|nr:hypothetical protein JZ00_30510 [Pseudomonas frederiksbergensis]
MSPVFTHGTRTARLYPYLVQGERTMDSKAPTPIPHSAPTCNPTPSTALPRRIHRRSANQRARL